MDPPHSCIHYAIEDRARQHPEAAAVVAAEDHLTYAELNARANQLAHHLRALGVHPNDLVALHGEFGCVLAVALLGILKSGAGYIPLDPSYPRGRTEHILRQSGARFLISWGDDPANAPSTVRLDTDWPAIAERPTTDPARVNVPDDAVYCIYTSGSTGEPKGALNLHRGVANLCSWYAGRDVGGGSGARTLVVSSIAYDLTQKNILEPLASGGLVIFASRRVGSVREIAAAVAAHDPTRVNCAPSAFRGLQDVVFGPSVSTVVLGGEPVDPRQAREITARGATVVNSYGPAECSDVALFHSGLAEQDEAVPLGAPIPGIEVVIVDAQDRELTGAGVGELLIGGAGVGAGYLTGPSQVSATHFVNRESAGAPGRFYRTGDIVRRAADGRLFYVGRADNQVKVRGHRIELEEIEALLLRHPGVAQCAALTHENRRGTREIAAFVVAASSAPPGADELRSHLARTLPEPVLPARWRFVSSLPLTANGKVSRSTLRNWLDDDDQPADTTRGAPADATEEKLLTVWREVLDDPDLGVENDFFASGGDSLAAIMLVLQLENAFSADVTLEHIYRLRTVRALASVLGPPAEASTRRGKHRMAPPGGHDFEPTLDQAYEIGKRPGPFTFLKYFTFGFEISGPLDVQLLREAILATANRQEALRMSFLADGVGGIRGHVAPPSDWRDVPDERWLQVVDLSDRPWAEALSGAVDAMRRSSFDVSEAPLFRCLIARHDDHHFGCAFTLHHTIADAWSMSVLSRSVGRDYERLRRGGPPEPPPAVRIGERGRAERTTAAAGGFDAARRFWERELTDLPPRLVIPAATLTRPVSFTFAADACRIDLDAARTASMIGLCSAVGVTPYSVLVTAMLLLWHRRTGQADLYLRTPSSTRGHADLADVIGPFSDALIIRTTVPASTPTRDFLIHVADGIVRARSQGGGLPAALWPRVAPVASDPAFGSSFQVVVNHHNYPAHPATWSDLRLTRLPESFAHIKCDLALHSWFQGGRLCCVLAYYTGIMTRTAAEGLLAELLGVLDELIAEAA